MQQQYCRPYLCNFYQRRKYINIVFLLKIGFLSLLVTSAKADSYLKEAPAFLKPCTLSDPNNGVCLGKALQNIFTNWKDGIPGLEGLSTIDPFKVKKVNFASNNANLNFKLELKDLIITGLSKAKVTKTIVNDEYNFKVFVKIPSVVCKGNYHIKGNIPLLNLNSGGPIEMEISDVEILFSLKTKYLKANNQKFLDVVSFNSNIKNIGNYHSHLGNLFNGNAELEESVNAAFNQNWRENFNLMRPTIEETFNAIALDRFKKTFAYVPANYIFTDLP